ncbi:MAG: hypothetical protein MUE40_11005 [Anaerolineae bacterium]|nr:hypothetical protein [Anaerolineae bacterium]
MLRPSPIPPAATPIPNPGRGLAGLVDRFIGPGATRAEVALQAGAGLAAVALLLAYRAAAELPWTAVQTIIAALLALDMAGGVVTNASAAAKRWYHRPGQGARQHLLFIAAHGVQLLLVLAFFRPGDGLYVAVAYGYLLVCAAGIVALPRYLQRPAAMLAWMGGLLLSLYGLPPVAGLEWFLPVFYLKLLVCHLLREDPFTPPPAKA